MANKPHSNLLSNPDLHHLYGIYDFEKRVFFKFGISDKPIQKNSSSSRIFPQVTLFNRVADSKRFSGRILIYSIQGRRNARKLEDAIILNFKEKYGKFPRGNTHHQFLKESN